LKYLILSLIFIDITVISCSLLILKTKQKKEFYTNFVNFGHMLPI